MNYIVLNGKSSKLIGGLMIQTLPPISKPLVRTEIEEIDGRDGDIVTKLGYSAYSKTFQIGLHGDYDVDEVIRYFDSEGIVTFSNELDKYYRYQIFEQIDFERLIRYKTAEVTMHVQPFKLSAVDKPVIMEEMLSVPDQEITENGITVTCEDGTISISGTASVNTEIYIPINSMYCRVGNHRITAVSSGDNCDAVSVRVVPEQSKVHPLNNGSIGLIDGTQSSTGLLTVPKTYHYIWMQIGVNVPVNITLDMSVVGLQVVVFNAGNTVSKPKVTLYGQGDIAVYLNGIEILVISDLASEITIDSESMEAYVGDILLNRKVFGDYNELAFRTGMNILSWEGNVTKAVVDRYSRWI